MKTHKLLLAAGTVGLLVAAQSSTAATLLDDTFGDGNLATNPDIGGGSGYVTNGAGTPGSLSEIGGQAQLTDGTAFNTDGIISSNEFDLSNSALTYTATWEVAKWDRDTSTAGVDRLFFSLQTNPDFIFGSADADASRVLLVLNTGGSAVFQYSNRDSGTNSALNSAAATLANLDDDLDGFTVTMTFDSTGYTATTTGLDADAQLNMSDTWANLGTDFLTVFGTDGNMGVSAYIQDSSSTGSELDIDRVTLTSVPEPGSLALLGLGSLCLVRRRRHGA